ncbi:PREDICTED: lipoma HMGIC fusion partner-like 3 protein [Priapulus caudatus]|uniref:Lipoma HMGIC fusion partner-like 3 protein n=1 Tax=Priapulus caudatus TaxID=37621 RepID=A0ABM1EXG0_PRICU|nr:PREDICTED: lipoma HMGIC fusion partner-like 3 protein [Priapulus caudatus]
MEVDKVTHTYRAKYVRNSRAIGVLWGVFTVCFAIVNLVAFVDAHWLGDTRDSPGVGHFGLYRRCALYPQATELSCAGELGVFNTILNIHFKVATVFVGVSALLVLLTICLMLLFFFLTASTVYMVCFWFQLLSAICMLIGCVVFPAGWDDDEVRAVCGAAGKYDRGELQVRAILAAVLVTRYVRLSSEPNTGGSIYKGAKPTRVAPSIKVRAILAAVLATRYVRLSSETNTGGSIYKDGAASVNGSMYRPSVYRGEVNQAYVSDAHSTISRKSMQLQPVSMPPHPDDPYSEAYSVRSLRTNRSRPGHYPSSVQDFQL